MNILAPKSSEEIRLKFADFISRNLHLSNYEETVLVDVIMTNNLYTIVEHNDVREIVYLFEKIIREQDLWDKEINEIQETISDIIVGKRLLNVYNAWKKRY